MEGNKFFLGNLPGVIANHPIDWLAPNGENIHWVASGLEKMEEEVLKICGFSKKWVIPFFNEIITPEYLIAYYKSPDTRMPRYEYWYIHIAAAYIKNDDLQSARKVVEENLGKLGQRMHYASVYKKLGIDPKLPQS